MNRRRFLLAATAFTLLSTTSARADYVEDIVEQLEKEGYGGIEVTRTLLGRVRILASKDGLQRELVCNPRTGEILRDVLIAANGKTQAPASPVGGGGDRNDDRGGDDESDDDDDDSSGGGGSGGDDDDDSGDGEDDDESGGDDSDDD